MGPPVESSASPSSVTCNCTSDHSIIYPFYSYWYDIWFFLQLHLIPLGMRPYLVDYPSLTCLPSALSFLSSFTDTWSWHFTSEHVKCNSHPTTWMQQTNRVANKSKYLPRAKWQLWQYQLVPPNQSNYLLYLWALDFSPYHLQPQLPPTIHSLQAQVQWESLPIPGLLQGTIIFISNYSYKGSKWGSCEVWKACGTAIIRKEVT